MPSMPDRLTILAQTAPTPDSGPDSPIFESWTWPLVGYGLLIVALAFYAACVALSGRDNQHRADAYKVLKLVWGTAVAATGLIGITLRLIQIGLL